MIQHVPIQVPYRSHLKNWEFKKSKKKKKKTKNNVYLRAQEEVYVELGKVGTGFEMSPFLNRQKSQTKFKSSKLGRTHLYTMLVLSPKSAIILFEYMGSTREHFPKHWLTASFLLFTPYEAGYTRPHKTWHSIFRCQLCQN